MQYYKVGGVSCSECASRIARAVEALPSVRSAEVHNDWTTLRIDGDPDEQAIRGAVSEAGYAVEGRI